MTSFDWRAIGIASVVGAIMGAGSLTGAYGPPVEFTLWTVFALAVWAPLVVRGRGERRFWSFVIVGALAGVWTGGIQAVFADTLVANNEAAAEMAVDGVTAGFRTLLVVSAVGIGAVFAGVTGALVLGALRLRAARTPPRAA